MARKMTFQIGETPVEIAPGIWLSYADGVLCVENEKGGETDGDGRSD